MTKDEAMKLALEAFETLTQYNMVRANIFRQFHPTATGDYVDLQEFREKALPAMYAICEALAEESSGTEQPAQQCNHCNGSGRTVRDPDIGTDQECFVCDGAGAIKQEQPAQQEPVAWMTQARNFVHLCEFTEEDAKLYGWSAVYTSPPAQRRPLHIGDESAEFKAWFDAWWVGDGEQGETIPTQSDKHFLTYMDQYTLGFGAWMAARHAAHGIKEQP